MTNWESVSNSVMAGLVPAIHVLQNSRVAGDWVCILTNRPNGILYVGVTSDLVRRIYEHRSGFLEGFTKRYGLKRLVYFEQFDDIRDAIQREQTSNTGRARGRSGRVSLSTLIGMIFTKLSRGKDVDGRDKPGHDELNCITTLDHVLDVPYPRQAARGPDLTLDPPAKLSIGRLQIVTRLKVDPKIRRGAEITREAERRVGG
jgi:putative endonuclease